MSSDGEDFCKVVLAKDSSYNVFWREGYTVPAEKAALEQVQVSAFSVHLACIRTAYPAQPRLSTRTLIHIASA